MTNGDLMEIFNSSVVKFNFPVLIQQPFGVSPRKKCLEPTPEGISVPQKSFHSWDMQDFCVCSCTTFLTPPAHHEGWTCSIASKCVPWQVRFWVFWGNMGTPAHRLCQAFGSIHECLESPVLFYQHWTVQQKCEQKDKWSHTVCDLVVLTAVSSIPVTFALSSTASAVEFRNSSRT